MDPSPPPDPEGLRLRQLFAQELHALPAETRASMALTAEEPVLSALCFDPLPAVVTQLLGNPRFGLVQARLLAAHHPHPSGLQQLAGREAFLRDAEVQRLLLRNVQLPPGVLQRVVAPRRLLEVYKLCISRELPEKNQRAAREALRHKFTNTAAAEDKVELLFHTEGRVLALLIGLGLDQKTAAILCARTYASLLLVQNLARWAPTPPSVLAHLLKQAVVKHQPQVRALILQHPNVPHHARHAGG
ncbi:MAG TPA: hypothetical protein VEJ89_06325 [Myxococcaceae bacterium]|jgi:hypothetical protein|nr:hypothetical protein [Myxococcaceae bacterium]